MPGRYRWVQLGDSVLEAFLLDPASLSGANIAEKTVVEQAARTGTLMTPTTLPEGMMLVAKRPEATVAFLHERHGQISRLTLRYAAEKMTPEDKRNAGL